MAGFRVTPSVVSFTNDDILVGNPASRKKIQNLENTVYDMKRLFGKSFLDENVQRYMKYWPFKLLSSDPNNRDAAPIIEVRSSGNLLHQRPVDISAKVLRKMKETAELVVDTPITRAVITVPAYFNQAQKVETREAANLAGLETMELITEPAAAAYAYGFDSLKYNKNKLLVFDLGGGTFDVSIIEVANGFFKVLAVGGDTNLGECDFDSALFEHCNEKVKELFGLDCSHDNNRKIRQLLLRKCEKLKINLSNSSKDSVYLGDLFAVVSSIDAEIIVTQDVFQQVCHSLLSKLMTITSETLKSANLKPSDITEILLVGGCSRIPAISERLCKIFPGKKLNRAINVDEVVAYGAAVRAAQLCENVKNEVPKISLIEATPLSLGTDIGGGRFFPMILKNSQVPTKVEKSFCTGLNDQSSMRFQIYEGERKLSLHNNLLGEFAIEGLSKGAARSTAVKFVFELDKNGILHARASHQKTDGTSVHASFDLNYNEKRTADMRSIEEMLRDAKIFEKEDQAEYDRKDALIKLEVAIRKVQYEIANTVPHDRTFKETQCRGYEDWIKQNQDASKEVFEQKLKAFEIGLVIESDDEDDDSD
ncbi:hsp70 protein domain-containing protein [Ditylenchus destructor]|uniref:Hsp70 protein domain-containing protein n=1 Tax=Ditylenchus destructor TaxID=166010 RepID=A0AAD4MGT4_9BILA|nr:hsp70 protein domain-containing protein [Ditylenchus destructor]